MLKRNTSGLQEHAQQKRDSAVERTERAIQKLLQEKKTINFGIVAQEAGVSRTWLYNQAEIRERIEELRNHSSAQISQLENISLILTKSDEQVVNALSIVKDYVPNDGVKKSKSGIFRRALEEN